MQPVMQEKFRRDNQQSNNGQRANNNHASALFLINWPSPPLRRGSPSQAPGIEQQPEIQHGPESCKTEKWQSNCRRVKQDCSLRQANRSATQEQHQAIRSNEEQAHRFDRGNRERSETKEDLLFVRPSRSALNTGQIGVRMYVF